MPATTNYKLAARFSGLTEAQIEIRCHTTTEEEEMNTGGQLAVRHKHHFLPLYCPTTLESSVRILHISLPTLN